MASAAEQMAANINFGAFSKATELKKRIWFTLGALIVYRLGTYIPLPGIDPNILAEIFRQNQGGILGLFDAATKFDAEKMVSFSSYAKHRIKGAILDSLRQLDWASRDLRRRHKQLEAATRELAGALHRAPSEAELATKMGVDVERWRQMMIDLRNVGLVSASQRPADQEDLPAPDFPAAAELQPDNMCSQQQMRSALGEAMKSLPERYQKVVALYYTNELTMKEIGGMLGINESRVSQIHKTALEKMAVVLQEAGIRSSAAF